MVVTSQPSEVVANLKDQYTKRAQSITMDRHYMWGRLSMSGERTSIPGGDLFPFIVGSYPGSFQMVGPSPTHVPRPAGVAGKRTRIQQAFGLGATATAWFTKELTRTLDAAYIEQEILNNDRFAAYVRKQLNRQAFGDGSGVIAVAIASVTGVASDSWTFVVPLNEGSGYFDIGTRVNFLATGVGAVTYPAVTGSVLYETALRSGTLRDTPQDGFYTVLNIVHDITAKTSTITIKERSPGVNSPANTDMCIMHNAIVENANSSSGTNACREMFGLAAHADDRGFPIQLESVFGYQADGAHQALFPLTTDGLWRAQVVDAGGTTRLGPTILRALALSHTKMGSKTARNAPEYWTHPDRVADFEQDFQAPGIRYPAQGPQPVDAPTGTSTSLSEPDGPSYGGKKIFADSHCRDTDLFEPDFMSFKKYPVLDLTYRPQHDDYGGAPADQQDSLMISQLGTEERTALGRIKRLDNSSSV